MEGKIRKFSKSAKDADENNTLQSIQASMNKIEEDAKVSYFYGALRGFIRLLEMGVCIARNLIWSSFLSFHHITVDSRHCYLRAVQAPGGKLFMLFIIIISLLRTLQLRLLGSIWLDLTHRMIIHEMLRL